MTDIHLDDPVKWAVTAFRDGRNETYHRLARYIAGDHPLAFAMPKYESVFGQRFTSFAYNRCEMATDAHADRLQLSGFSAGDDTTAQAAQDVWDANRMDTREGHLYGDAFGLGDAYVIVEKHPDTDEVLYWVNTPDTMRVHWSNDKPDEIDLAAKFWIGEDERGYLTIYKRGEIEKYVTTQKSKSGMPRSASAFERREVDNEPWPLKLDVPDQVPVFHIANNGRANSYGVSELRSVLPLQDALNKSVTDMMVAMELGAFPQRVLIGVDVPTTEEEKKLVSAFEAGITRVWTMSNEQGKVAEFSAANIAQFIAVAEYFDKCISRVTKIPVHWLGMSAEIESGRARRIAEAAFVAKMESRQHAYGYQLSELSRYALRLQGMNVAPGDIRINWKSAESVTEEDVYEQMLTKKSIGYPLTALLREGGYEPGQIEQILTEKQRATDEAAMMFARGASLDIA